MVSTQLFNIVVLQLVLLYANVILNAIGVLTRNKPTQAIALIPLGIAAIVGFIAFGMWLPAH